MQELKIVNNTSVCGRCIKDSLSKYLSGFKIEITDPGNLIPPQRGYARKLAGARFLNRKKGLSSLVKDNIINIELKLLKKAKSLNGVIYHGFKYQKILKEIFPLKDKNTFTVILTDRLLATPEIEGGHPHVRIAILGYPGIVLTRGIIKGPARSRKKDTKDDYIGTLSDERLRDVIPGYIMQTVFYFFLGESFCDKKGCRLYNAHWQKDMIKAQLEKPAFCKKHSKMLEYLAEYNI